MPVKISYSNKKLSNSNSNLVLFFYGKNNVNGLKKYVSSDEFNYINDLLKNSDFKKNLFTFELSSKKKITLVSIKEKLKNSDIENLGAEFYKKINFVNNNEYFLISDSVMSKYENFIAHFLHGLKLKSYEFKKYKSKKKKETLL